MSPAAPSLDELERGVRAGDWVQLARAITLIESALPTDQERARELLARLAPLTGRAWRVGISGVPGVGKSTFIEALGTRLCAAGKRVAVLAVDPSSALSGGSILGDKSRMTELATLPGAFIRPSPNARSLGGVARRTRESMQLCEAAGHDVVLVETVGVGQSETEVAEMVDFFLVLLLPGAGDELQGIKKGILELADLIAINKADGDNLARAHQAVSEIAAALHYLTPHGPGTWTPRAVSVSARTGAGLDELWSLVEEHRAQLEATGELATRRATQLERWMWREVEARLREHFHTDSAVRASLPETLEALRAGRLTPSEAATGLLAAFERTARESTGGAD